MRKNKIKSFEPQVKEERSISAEECSVHIHISAMVCEDGLARG
jgi:hypothetical protein